MLDKEIHIKLDKLSQKIAKGKNITKPRAFRLMLNELQAFFESSPQHVVDQSFSDTSPSTKIEGMLRHLASFIPRTQTIRISYVHEAKEYAAKLTESDDKVLQDSRGVTIEAALKECEKFILNNRK